jgi:hypothetical protein
VRARGEGDEGAQRDEEGGVAGRGRRARAGRLARSSPACVALVGGDQLAADLADAVRTGALGERAEPLEVSPVAADGPRARVALEPVAPLGD